MTISNSVSNQVLTTTSNPAFNNVFPGYTTTATAAATTNLAITDTYYQYWTGVTTQTVTLPHTGTILGTSYYFVNNSTGNVTVEASGGQTVQVMAGGSSCLFTCISAGGTTAASWNAQYFIDSDVSGAVLLAPTGIQTITTYGLVMPSVNFSSTSGIIGTTTNNDAAAGSVGEYLTATRASGSALSVTTGTTADVTTLSLTAGDWDVWGIVATSASAGTTTTQMYSWINTTSASLPADGLGGGAVAVTNGTAAATQNTILPCGMTRLSLSTTTTVYLSTNVTFAVSSMAVYGGIYARRRR